MKGQSIVKAVMAELLVGQKDFLGPSRLPRHVNARIVAIERLRSAGLNKHEVARAINRDESTVRYLLKRAKA